MKKVLSLILCIVILMSLSGCDAGGDVEVIFDADSLYYQGDDGLYNPYTIKMLKKEFGEPNETDTWKYDGIDGLTYEMKDMYYDDFYFVTHNKRLLRVRFENVDLTGKSNKQIIKMFGLDTYANTDIEDNGYVFKATNTGVYEFEVYDYGSDSARVDITYWDFPW